MDESLSFVDPACDASVWRGHLGEASVGPNPNSRPTSVYSFLRERIKDLEAECASIRESNAMLQAALERLTAEKRATEVTIVTNVEKVLLPILNALEGDVRPDQRTSISLVKENLARILSPLADQVAHAFMSLTAVEHSICQMIRDGRTTKEIAEMRHVSPATVARQRERIRRKLGLTGTDANLGTYMRNFLVERS